MKLPLRAISIQAFTLIEILVSTVILVLLIALALPAYNSILDKSHSAECAQNLRNYGLAALNFIAEQPDGVVLPYLFWKMKNDGSGDSTHDGSRGASHWYQNIADYGVGNAPSAHTCLTAEVKYKSKVDGKLGHAELSNYGWNCWIPYNEKDPLLRIVEVRSPSKLFLCADSTASKKMKADNTGSSWNITGVIEANLRDPDRRQNFSFRHGGRANILFADGHVEALAPEQIPVGNKAQESWLKFWKGRL